MFNRVRIPGGKHSFAHSIACGALTKECRFYNVPIIRDSKIICEILENIFEVVNLDEQLYKLELRDPIMSSKITITNEQLSQSRNIFCILPALLNRTKEIIITGIPKGCDIGDRPTDWYFSILESFGVEILKNDKELKLRWRKRKAAKINFSYPTMTGTVIALACASIVKGKSELYNCSVEPSCFDQVVCMQQIGVNINGNLPDLEICTSMLHKTVDFMCSCDRVYAVTLLSAAVLAEVDFEVYSESEIRIPKFVEFLEQLNLDVIDNVKSIKMKWKNKNPLKSVSLNAGSEPKFSSDWVTFALLILATKVNGKSIVIDDVFIKRFQFISCYEDLKNLKNVELLTTTLGGRAAVVAKINGENKNNIPGGITKVCPDIRGSAAIVLSTLISKTPIEFSDDFQISRGYEDLIGDMQKIGFIERID